MKLRYQVCILSLLLYFSTMGTSRAQQTDIYTHQSLAEKIYLQLDGKVYTSDQTIWFKCLVRQAIDHSPSQLSVVLYVELIDPDEKIVEKKLIKITEGIGAGFFRLSPHYLPGKYLVRAYTQWNKNFETDFFFEEYIQIFDSEVKNRLAPIRHINLLETTSQLRHLQATLDPFIIDSLHKKGLKLFVSIDGNKDSLSLKKNKEGLYLLDYPIPANCRFVTLQMQSKNERTYSKTIAVDEDYLDLQFFPESGEMVHGLGSKVGFKALDYARKGKMVSGAIVDNLGDTLTVFESNLMGMGIFVMTQVDRNKTYYAQLSSQEETGQSLLVPLPKVAVRGNILSVNGGNVNIHISVSSNYLKTDNISIRVSCRGKGYYDIKGRLIDGKLSTVLKANSLPEGILAFSMTDQSGQVLAERLYFNERPETRLDIKVKPDQEVYSQRQKTHLNLGVTNREGKPVPSNLSVLVINKEQLGKIQDTRESILTYFLLSSDLKGEIENPGFYFRKDRLSHLHLDALMLTQGWRKYQYTRPVGEIHFSPEPLLMVSGHVKGLSSKKRKGDVALTMVTFGDPQSFHTQATDSLGRFAFDLNDQYGQRLNILIQSAKKSGKKLDYTIELDKKVSPSFVFKHEKSLERVDSIIQVLVEKNMERKEIEDAAIFSDGLIVLDEVVVTDYRLTPNRKKVITNYGEPDVVIDGKEVLEKKEKWSHGLYSVIKFHYQDLIKIWKLREFLYAEVQNSVGPTLVVVDGIPVREYEYPFIPNIPINSVSSFEIIKNAKSFKSHYLNIFPEVHPLDAPGFGNILAIYTYAGKGLHGATPTVGIFKAAVPVFSQTIEFYAPKYPSVKAEDFYTPDLRALIHWEPNISVNAQGKASVSFYNADIEGNMQVVIEAISEKGEIGYKEVFYEVQKRVNKN